MRGARFLHVGDRDQADLEALLRLLELTVDRLQRRVGGRQRILGREHVEIGLRDAHQQVLLRSTIVRFRERDLRIGTPELLPLVPAEQASA